MHTKKLYKKILVLPILGVGIVFLLTLALDFAEARSLTLQEETLFSQLIAQANATLSSNTSTDQEKRDAEITLQQIQDRIAEIRAETVSQDTEEVSRLIREAAQLVNKENPTEDELKRAQSILERAKSKANELEGDSRKELKEQIEALLLRIKVLLNKSGDTKEDRDEAKRLLQQLLQMLQGARQNSGQIKDQVKNVGRNPSSTLGNGSPNNPRGGNTGTGQQQQGGNTGTGQQQQETQGPEVPEESQVNTFDGQNQGGNTGTGQQQETQGPEVPEESQVNTFDGQNQGSGAVDKPAEFPTQCQEKESGAKEMAQKEQQKLDKQLTKNLTEQALSGQAVPVDTISINKKIENIEKDTATIKQYLKWLTEKEAGLGDGGGSGSEPNSLDAIAYCYAVEMALYQAEAAANWIQKAYKENPAFIEDYPRFFQETSDKATREFLDDFKENSACKSIDKQIQITMARESISGPTYTIKCSIEDSKQKENTVGSFLERYATIENSGAWRSFSAQADLEVREANAVDLRAFELDQSYLINKKDEESGEIQIPGRFLLQDALRRTEVPYDLLANFDENSEKILLDLMKDIFKGGPGAIYRKDAGISTTGGTGFNFQDLNIQEFEPTQPINNTGFETPGLNTEGLETPATNDGTGFSF